MKENNDNILLVAFPSNALVGTFAIAYIVYSQKMPHVGEIELEELPPALFVENGEIIPPIQIYKKDNIHVISSEQPFDPYLAHTFAYSVLEYCKENKIGKILMTSGMETVNKSTKDPNVYGLTTHQSLEKILYDNDIPKFLSGSIFGTDAAILSVFRKSDIPALVLYVECHPFFPDPNAAIMAITTLSKILKIKTNTADIQKRIEQLRIQHRNLMEETIKTLQQQQEKTSPPRIPQIYK